MFNYVSCIYIYIFFKLLYRKIFTALYIQINRLINIKYNYTIPNDTLWRYIKKKEQKTRIKHKRKMLGGWIKIWKWHENQLKRYTGVLVLSLGLFLCTSNDSLMHSNASVLALPMIEKSFCVELHIYIYIYIYVCICICICICIWKPGIVAMQWIQFNTRASTQVI